MPVRAAPRVPARPSPVPDNLKVAAFNIRIFGTKKMNDPRVADVLTKVKPVSLG